MCIFPDYKLREQALKDFFHGSEAAKIACACYWSWTNKFRDNWMACYKFLSVYLAIDMMGVEIRGRTRVGVETRDKAGVWVRVLLLSIRTRALRWPPTSSSLPKRGF